jgi:hypothetical protein
LTLKLDRIIENKKKKVHQKGGEGMREGRKLIVNGI